MLPNSLTKSSLVFNNSDASILIIVIERTEPLKAPKNLFSLPFVVNLLCRAIPLATTGINSLSTYNSMLISVSSDYPTVFYKEKAFSETERAGLDKKLC